MRLQRILAGLFLLGFVFSGELAWAFKSGQVATEGAELKQGPSDTSPTLGKLKLGTKFNASDAAVQGYYRVRTSTGTGYLREQDITLQEGVSAPSAAGQGGAKGKKRTSRATGPKSDFRLLGGATLASPSDYLTAFGITSIGTVISFGAEYAYLLGSRSFPWGLMLRFEHLGQSLTLNDPNTTISYSFALSSNELLAGPFYRLVNSGGFKLRIAALLGYTVGSSVTVAGPTSTTTTATATTPTTYSYSNLCILGKLDAAYGWRIGSNELNVVAEIGYRMAKSAQVAGVSGSGDAAFGGTLSPLALDLSGVTGGIGLGFAF